MVAVRVRVNVGEDGKVLLQLPNDFPRGEQELVIEQIPADKVDIDERPLTEKEVEALLKPEPKSGAEIAAWILEHGGGWEDKGIDDPVAWLEEQRRKRHEKIFDASK